jgi:hypothetical protein
MPRPKKTAAAPRGATVRKTSAKTAAKPRAPKTVKTRAKVRAHKTAGLRGAAPARAVLSGLSTEALAAELARRRSELPRLEQQAAALRGQLAALESRIALLSGDAAPAPARLAAKAAAPRGGTEGKRGPRARRDGRPTLGVLIAQILGESRDALALRDIAERAAKALGRAVNPSFLVQTSQTLRKLVVRGAAAQPSRGMYARGAGVAEAVKEGSHAGESDQRQE